MKVSVIVPVFNTEAYLGRCVESIANQTFRDFEIILVNDGSTDSSGSICDSWAKKDSRIRVIHKKNEGVTIARKTGVEHSTGEWICFVDSDDKLPERSIEILFKHVRDDVDIIIGVLEYNGYFNVSCKHNYEEQNTLKYLKSILKNKAHGGPVARLIRKNLFDAFTFDIPPEIKRGEDIIMNLRLAQKARLIIFLPDIVYNYLWNPESATSKNSSFISSISSELFWHRIIRQSIGSDYKKALRWAMVYFYCRRWWWVLLKRPAMQLKRKLGGCL
jgi:glycosyltransferase involved in cell wall biosynthesis